MTFCTKAICFAFWWTWRMPAWQLRGQVLPPCAPADQTGYLWTPGHNLLCCPVRWWIGTSPKSPYKAKKTTNRLVQRFIVLLVRSRELESLALWLKEPTGQNTLILEVSSLRHFCAKHRDFLPGNFCTLCRILQIRVPIASLETVQKQCRNRALTLGQIKNDDFWSMTWWRFEWPQR